MPWTLGELGGKKAHPLTRIAAAEKSKTATPPSSAGTVYRIKLEQKGGPFYILAHIQGTPRNPGTPMCNALEHRAGGTRRWGAQRGRAAAPGESRMRK